MDGNALLMFLRLCFFQMVLATECNECSHCYTIKPATISGIIVGDVALTVLIIIVVFHCASQRRKRQEEADRVYTNVRANCKAW